MFGKILKSALLFLLLNFSKDFFSTQLVASTSLIKLSVRGKLMEVRNLLEISLSK